MTNVCKANQTLASCVQSMYGVDDTLYYHDSNLANGAGDNSYRYAGAHDEVNNFVCFGSNEATCPDDNLYRIIGVFGDQVKLIKWDYANGDLLGTDGEFTPYIDSASDYPTYKGSKTIIKLYYWNHTNQTATYSATNYYNIWSYSKLNTVNLNTNFLNNIGTEWSNKIAETTWKVGGNEYENTVESNAQTAYTNEITNSNTDIESTYKAKVALMYTSDYGFAASPSAWTANLNTYYSYINDNWMHMGLGEWSVVRYSDVIYSNFYVVSDGGVGGTDVTYDSNAVRPVFYLVSSVNYGSGAGTKADLVRLS